MKLINMTDFVLEQKLMLNIQGYEKKFISNVSNYAKFLKQPLELVMFVPIDEHGNVMEEPHNFGLLHTYPTGNKLMDQSFESALKYQKAKENVLFEGFEVIGVDENHVELELINNDFWIDFFKHSATIITDSYHIEYPVKLCEDLLEYNLILTESAIKQLGL